jgi:hypothetical protein
LALEGDHLQFSEDWFINNIIDKYLKWVNIKVQNMLLYRTIRN